MSFGRTSSTTGNAQLTTDPARRGQIEKLLRDEETKLKKYDEDHKKSNDQRDKRLDGVSSNVPNAVGARPAIEAAADGIGCLI